MMMMTMKSGLSGPFLFLLLSHSVFGLGSVVFFYYKYLPIHDTWHGAQSFCRHHGGDLATIYQQSHADHINLTDFYAWIGLRRMGNTFLRNGWVWSDGESDTLHNWASDEPGNDNCALVTHSDRWVFHGANCGEYHFFNCERLSSEDKVQFIFIPQSKTWSEAEEYCRNEYDDLAIFKDHSEVRTLNPQQDFPVWTGLHRHGETLKWSRGWSEYRNWAPGEPGNSSDCVSISSLSKEMTEQKCSHRFPFICIFDNLVLVKENKTWGEALEHCRALRSPHHHSIRYELVSVQPGEDQKYTMSTVMEADTEKVWAGLRFLAGQWLWVNNVTMLYSDLPLCPSERQHCGALSKNDMGSMEAVDCSEKQNFICYRIP